MAPKNKPWACHKCGWSHPGSFTYCGQCWTTTRHQSKPRGRSSSRGGGRWLQPSTTPLAGGRQRAVRTYAQVASQGKSGWQWYDDEEELQQKPDASEETSAGADEVDHAAVADIQFQLSLYDFELKGLKGRPTSEIRTARIRELGDLITKGRHSVTEHGPPRQQLKTMTKSLEYKRCKIVKAHAMETALSAEIDALLEKLTDVTAAKRATQQEVVELERKIGDISSDITEDAPPQETTASDAIEMLKKAFKAMEAKPPSPVGPQRAQLDAAYQAFVKFTKDAFAEAPRWSISPSLRRLPVAAPRPTTRPWSLGSPSRKE